MTHDEIDRAIDGYVMELRERLHLGTGQMAEERETLRCMQLSSSTSAALLEIGVLPSPQIGRNLSLLMGVTGFMLHVRAERARLEERGK